MKKRLIRKPLTRAHAKHMKFRISWKVLGLLVALLGATLGFTYLTFPKHGVEIFELGSAGANAVARMGATTTTTSTAAEAAAAAKRKAARARDEASVTTPTTTTSTTGGRSATGEGVGAGTTATAGTIPANATDGLQLS